MIASFHSCSAPSSSVPAPPCRQQGIGLVEVMISVTLGLIVLAALLKSYSDSKTTFRTQDGLARVQENARLAMHIIGRDLRMAGYRSCVRDGVVAATRNTLNSPADFLFDFLTPVQGFDGNADGSWAPALPGVLGSARTGTDVLVLRGALDGGHTVRQEMGGSTDDLVIAVGPAASPPEAGDIVMVSDCLGSAIFQVTRYLGGSGSVEHDAGAATQPGNSTRNLGRRYPMGAGLLRIATTSYFIRDGNNGPSLWRKTGASPAQELVEGVLDMQVQYGLDADGDRMPDRYANAASVADFRETVSVRIALLFRSLEPLGGAGDPRSFSLLDRTVGPFNDSRMYQVMTSTITLRNRAL